MKTTRLFAILWLVGLGSLCSLHGETFWKSNIQYQTISNDEVEIIGNEVTTNTLNIPTQVTYEGVTYSVTSIGNNAFANSSCTSISLPNTIRSIGSSAFKGAQIQSFIVPDSVTRIEYSTFENCAQLAAITTHNNITEIGNYAFKGCTSLTSITLPSELEEISESCFRGSGLTTISPKSKVKVIKSKAFADCSSLASISMPSSLEEIGDSSFVNCGFSTLSFSSNVKIIRNSAFASCPNLRRVTIPDSVEDIEEKAFYNCSVLLTATLGNGIKHIGYQAFYATKIYPTTSTTSNIYIGNYALRINNPKEIKNTTCLLADKSLYLSFKTSGKRDTIVIPGNVKYVGNYLINDSYVWLASGAIEYAYIEFSEGVQFVGDNLCKLNYKSGSGSVSFTISLPSTIKQIGTLSCNTLYWNIPNYPDFTMDNRPAFSTIYFGENVLHIPAYICYIEEDDRTSIISYLRQKTIYEASNVRSIGAYAFAGCRHIFSFPSTLDSIGEHAFEDNTSFTHLELPDNIVYLGDYAFLGCAGVTQVDLGAGLTEINDGVFKGCSSLDRIYIPQNITKLGNEVFRNCTKLSRMTNPSNSLISIGSRCFQKCTTLTNFDIPTSVDTLGAYAFANCSALTTLTWGQNLRTLQNGTFAECTKLANVVLGENIVSIGDSCFFNCTKLNYFKGENLQHIGAAAFVNCTSLKTFTFDDKITSIGGNVFNGCNALKSLTWNVPTYSFSQYTPLYDENYDLRAKIDTVYFGDSVRVVPYKLCEDMNKLKRINIGTKVEDITYQHILGCKTLSDIIVKANNPFLISIDGVVFSADTTEFKVYPQAKNGSSYTIPIPVEEISEGAFFDCSKLNNMKMENNIRRIGKSAFEGCMKLTSITLGRNVESIGDQAFYNDSILSTIKSEMQNIPSISPNVFWYFRPKTKQIVDPTRKIYLYIAEHRQAEYKAMPVWQNMKMITHREEGIWKVQWKDWDNKLLKEEYVNDGESATPPEEEPSREGYNFIGWDKSYDNVTSDLVIKALYNKTEEGIEDIMDGNNIINSKILHDDHIYIIRGDKVYTLTGQKVH